MKALLLFLYSLGLRFYVLSARLLALFNPKIAAFIRGRENIFELIGEELKDKNEKRIWFHFASLGEFEQGRPLMEQLKLEYPSYKIFITFFSPSGYDVQKNYSGADYIFYLPFDTKSNARKFITLVNPELIVFVKYEFWLHYLSEIKRKNIPCILISAVFRADQIFFKPFVGSYITSYLHAFHYIFLQNEDSGILAKKLLLPGYKVAGDTRFDRVKSITQKVKDLEDIKRFTAGKTVLVAGSSWPAEEAMLAHTYQQPFAAGFCFILVPHDVSPKHIGEIKLNFPDALVYSKWDKEKTDANVLIIDRIGLLSSLYQYAHVALVGGGFGKGLHNILEAAAYGVPVLFGPNTSKFWEADALIEAGGALSISSEQHFEREFRSKINSPSWREEAGAHAAKFIQSNMGATEIILKELRKNNWLN